MKKTNNSFKEIQPSQSDTIDQDEDNFVEPYKNTSALETKKKDDLGNRNMINKIQAKYGIVPSLPSNSRSKKRRTVNGISLSNGMRKAYSNTGAEVYDPIVKMNTMSEKTSKLPIKKKFLNHNKLPEIIGNKNILPKI
mmetsp:Transcript_751/g.624  ORF Transcript_751/g.624 Transcript_751/m.624 type:complete len:138 (+) Transcript_751:447-860(+)